MADENEGTGDAVPLDPKRELAAGIYSAWRNAYLNELPVAAFSRLEAASEHLITEIAAHL